MGQRFDPAHMARLDSPERRKMLPPEEILRDFELSAGETMVDVGAGTGFFALPGSRMVGPAGRVIALDASREMAEELAQRADAQGVTNVDVRISEEYDFGIGSDGADLVLLSQVLHEVDDKVRLLQEALRVLKPGGRIGIIEWQAVETERGPRLVHRLTPAQTDDLLERAGFRPTLGKVLNDLFYLTSAVK